MVPHILFNLDLRLGKVVLRKSKTFQITVTELNKIPKDKTFFTKIKGVPANAAEKPTSL